MVQICWPQRGFESVNLSVFAGLCGRAQSTRVVDCAHERMSVDFHLESMYG